MDIRGKKFLVIGGAGLIGSHTVDALLKEDVGEVIVYDNFVRGAWRIWRWPAKTPVSRCMTSRWRHLAD